MEKRRDLKTAVSDPSPEEKRIGGVSQEGISRNSAARRAGIALLGAAVAIGFIGGWLTKKWLRIG